MEKAQELLTAEVVSKLEDSNWKERLDGIEKMSTLVKRLPKESIPCQVCVRTIAKKPGFKDNNFQVSTMYWLLLNVLMEIFDFGTLHQDLKIPLY